MARDRPPGVELSRAHAESRRREVVETELPPAVAELSEEYDRRVGDRDRYLWKWIHNLFDAFTLSCVPEGRRESVKTTKTVLTMFVTVLDDLADRRRDGATFAQARRVPYAPGAVDPETPGVDGELVRFVRRLWDAVETRLLDAPRRGEFDDLLAFDLRAVIAAMDYARVLNDTPSMANLEGTRHYGPHNMTMFPYADVDLMYSPGFDAGELGALRALVWDLQRMARIGNWVTTWRRELREDDYSAGVVVAALERGLFDPRAGCGRSADEAAATIEAHGLDREFLREWRRRFDAVRRRSVDVATVDTDRLIDGMRTVMEHHLASDGYK